MYDAFLESHIFALSRVQVLQIPWGSPKASVLIVAENLGQLNYRSSNVKMCVSSKPK